MTKSILQSKTFWVAGVQAAIGVLVVFSTTYPDLGWVMLAKSMLDVFLRAITTQPVSTTA